MTHAYPSLLAVELAGTGTHPASWRRADSRAEDLFTGRYWVDAVSTVDRAGLDLAFLPDSFMLQSGGVRGRLEAAGIAARVAVATHRIGLIPQAPVTHTEPFHVSKAIASLDYATHGRAGWEVTISPGEQQTKLFGRKPKQIESALWREADEAIEVVTRLWDSWEDDAEIRDIPTGRFIDRDKLHYIDFVGDNFSVKGPAITPRPPQGQPLVAVRADGAHATRVAVQRADLIRIASGDLASAAETRSVLRIAATAAGRDPQKIRVLLDVEVHLAASVTAAADEVATLEDWTATPGPNTVRHIGTVDTLRDLLSRVHQECAADGVVLQPLALASFLNRVPMLTGTLRRRRVHPRPAPDTRRTGRIRRHGGPGTPGTWQLSHRIHRHDPARTPGSAPPPSRGRKGAGIMTVPLSILDLSPISAGSDARQAIRNTIDLARRAEAWGYRRYWVAEHHFVAVASSAPTELIALIAAATETIRVGSAAVQVGHHASASVVEAFGTIDALYPGRLDLGLGRSADRISRVRSAAAAPSDVADQPTVIRDGVVIPPPFSPARIRDTSRLAASLEALHPSGAEPPEYARQVEEVRALLAGTYTTLDGIDLHAVPGEGAQVQLWLFGSSGGESARLAGRLGLPFAANYHVSPGTILETVDAYRASFRPSTHYREPYLVVSADVVVAGDDETARHLASTYGHWVYSIRSGAGAAEYLDPDTAPPLTEQQWNLVHDRVTTQFVGTPEYVAERLTTLQRLTGADELVVTSVTHRHEDRLTSHCLLAREWGLPQVRAA